MIDGSSGSPLADRLQAIGTKTPTSPGSKTSQTHHIDNSYPLKKNINDFEHKDDVQNGDPASPEPIAPTNPARVGVNGARISWNVGPFFA